MIWLRMRRVGRTALVISLSTVLIAGCGGNVGNNGNNANDTNDDNGMNQSVNDSAGLGGVQGNGTGAGQGLRQQMDHSRHGQQGKLGQLGQQNGAGGRYGMQAAGTGNEAGQAVVPLEKVNGKAYADAEKMAGLIGFQTVYSDDKRELMIGDHDPVLTFTADSAEAKKEEGSIKMKSPAVMKDGRILVPADALQRLFGGEAVFTVNDGEVAIFPQPQQEDPQAAGGEDFGDDPQDPAAQAGEAEAAWTEEQQLGLLEDGAEPAIANASALIRDAKRFLGVPYKFGAGPYSRTKRFDCSSFTRYLFAKRGVTLPRTARAQATKGVWVPRSKLRVGDLMYFYVPGRFKSNKKVGHVGIYMGNRKMIHSSPLPKDGVQITNIDKAYWKRTYLYSKRVS
jgi:cell wall-associated NlpC family hydrolase